MCAARKLGTAGADISKFGCRPLIHPFSFFRCNPIDVPSGPRYRKTPRNVPTFQFKGFWEGYVSTIYNTYCNTVYYLPFTIYYILLLINHRNNKKSYGNIAATVVKLAADYLTIM